MEILKKSPCPHANQLPSSFACGTYNILCTQKKGSDGKITEKWDFKLNKATTCLLFERQVG